MMKKAATEPYLVEAHIGAHAPFTVPDAGLEMLREAVKATGRGLHIHAAEDLYDVSYSHHWYGKDLLARLAQFDLIDSKTLVAHGLCTCRKMTSPYSISAMRSGA